MKLLITGHTSSISKELIKILKKNPDLEIFFVGRKKNSSFYCDFSDYFSFHIGVHTIFFILIVTVLFLIIFHTIAFSSKKKGILIYS